MDGVVIRECKPEELDRAWELSAAMYVEVAPEEGITREEMSSRLGEYCLVAEAAGDIVGLVIAERQTMEFMESEVGRCAFPDEKEYLEIQDLYVAPEFRGRGIGKKLMMTVLQLGRDNGLQRSMVYSANEDYVSIAKFYEGCGYKMWHIFMTQ